MKHETKPQMEQPGVVDARLLQDSRHLIEAVKRIYPMIISANLTRNTYHMVEYDRDLARRAQEEGRFDELIRVGAATMHPDYRAAFAETFSRENLLRRYAQGETEVYMESLQMGDDGAYHWVSTRNIRVSNPENEDVLLLSLNHSIDERKQKELALAAAERDNEANRIFLNAVSGGVVMLRYTPAGVWMPEFLSEGFAAMTGMTVEQVWEIYRQDAMTGVHPDDQDKLGRAMSDYFNSDDECAELTYRLRKGDGGYIWVRNALP